MIYNLALAFLVKISCRCNTSLEESVLLHVTEHREHENDERVKQRPGGLGGWTAFSRTVRLQEIKALFCGDLL